MDLCKSDREPHPKACVFFGDTGWRIMKIRDRIKELRRVKASELSPNPVTGGGAVKKSSFKIANRIPRHAFFFAAPKLFTPRVTMDKVDKRRIQRLLRRVVAELAKPIDGSNPQIVLLRRQMAAEAESLSQLLKEAIKCDV